MIFTLSSLLSLIISGTGTGIGMSEGFTPKKCVNCIHFKPDGIYHEIGRCGVYDNEFCVIVRNNYKMCGRNGTHFESCLYVDY